MNDKLYIKMKLMLMRFDFDKPASFKDLFLYAKQYTHGRQFKQFVKICQNMGVSSKVVRGDGGLVRVLVYDKSSDKYLKGEVELLQACEHCNGSGVVKKPVEVPNV